MEEVTSKVTRELTLERSAELMSSELMRPQLIPTPDNDVGSRDCGGRETTPCSGRPCEAI